MSVLSSCVYLIHLLLPHPASFLCLASMSSSNVLVIYLLLHLLAVFKSSDYFSAALLHLACPFFMLPSCGLFSVNLLIKMPAKDTNHLKNRFEEEKCLYRHCFLCSCCLLSLAGKMSGLEYSFTLKFFLSGDSYGSYFFSLPYPLPCFPRFF